MGLKYLRAGPQTDSVTKVWLCRCYSSQRASGQNLPFFPNLEKKKCKPLGICCLV